MRWGLLLWGALAACNGKAPGSTAPPRPAEDAAPADLGDPAACDALADRVTALYEAEKVEHAADNAAMILADCRTHPNRFVPCIEAAASVAALERDCVIPLDDEGTVEGRQFSK